MHLKFWTKRERFASTTSIRISVADMRESHHCILTFSESHNVLPSWFNPMFNIPLPLFRFSLLYLHALFFSYSWQFCLTFQLAFPLISYFCLPLSFCSLMYSDSLAHSSVWGYTGQQGLLSSWRLMLKWWDLQSTSADFASVCGGQWQHEAWPRCQEPVCQRSVCPTVQPITWLPV